MRIINGLPFSEREQETFRLHMFYNLVSGMRALLDAMRDLPPADQPDIASIPPPPPPEPEPEPVRPSSPDGGPSRSPSVSLDLWRPGSLNPRQLMLRQELEYAPDLREGQIYPLEYHEILKELWDDPVVKAAIDRAHAVALPDK